MKKTILIIIIAVIVVALGAFLALNMGEKNVEGTLEEIMTKVYAGIPEEEKPMMLGNIPVDAESVEYYLGTADIEYEEALASESGVGSIAHSVVLVRVKDGANVEEVKAKIKENVNPRKWICVGVEEDQVIVKSKGDLVILIMAQTGSEKLEQNFDNL